ncbi:CRISPR-associated protein, Cse4 family [Catenulispora acidiphila DSM 44928]|uniref:CRISPR-associated protein, Cse4 family n=1 Tax=Catenulispora acidiphila (strain DSM 44928 / JCM 14897 / NBRC 102108 / NRRL B-24433 / ID139908) TaxID=479433 RepID=C7QEM5_CATAD|nr:type I-E CRISPR-associated protein Cas7/Cse4/CasC [Catenulispora acidiphila]ACU72795.1 CRISPR-associated protein, Cse4 family [Catenulispora acidiphila DSM 44928]
MTRVILDIHILQTVPPSNLNRDDTGSPKTAVYGGVRRARVSSQAWKRATRQAFGDLLDPSELGVRTKRVAEQIANRMTALEPSLSPGDAVAVAVEVIKAATGAKSEVPKRKSAAVKSDQDATAALPETGYLMFLSESQLNNLARLGVEGSKDITAFLKDKDFKNRVRQAADTRHSVDIALFGRMVADATDINVDAAAQVAHAISVHAVENESDYFTAVDDRSTEAEPGAGMIGIVDFNAATLYRYAAVDVNRLADNLGAGLLEGESQTEPVRRAVEAFIRGFALSMPTGKVNTFGNHTVPDVVLVKLRASRPISFAAAFEEAISAGEHQGGYLKGACERLASYIPKLEQAYDLQEGTDSWVVCAGSATEALEQAGDPVSISQLVAAVGAAVTTRLASDA